MSGPGFKHLMFTRQGVATAWAMQARSISPAAWKVLVILAHRVNNKRHDFDVWPRQKELAEECDMPVSTLKRQLDELEGKKFIERVTRFRADGGVAGCTYRLMVKATFEMPSGNVDYDFPADDEEGDGLEPLAQNELPPLAQNEPTPSPSVGYPLAQNELARTYRNITLEEEIPPSPIGEDAPTENSDLFGEHLPAEIEPPIADRVLEAWHDLKRQIPGIADISVLDDARAKKIGARAAIGAKLGLTPWETWQRVFEAIPRSKFLSGLVPPGRNHASPMKLTIDFVLRPAEYLKILEGAYDDRPGTSFGTHDDDGRRFGPSEQAGRAAVDSVLARRSKSRQRFDPRGGQGSDHPRLSGPAG